MLIIDSTWCSVVHLIRFGDNSTANYYEAWGSMQQTDLLEDYVSTFIELSVQVPNLEEEHYFGQFLIGLRPDIHMKIQEDTITDVYAAIKWAQQIECEINVKNDGQFRHNMDSMGTNQIRPGQSTLTPNRRELFGNHK